MKAPVPAPVQKKQALVTTVNPLFEKKPKQRGSLTPTRDLHGFVKWPNYVHIQRHVLNHDLKAPPALNAL